MFKINPTQALQNTRENKKKKKKGKQLKEKES